MWDEFDSSLMSISGIGERPSGLVTIALIPSAATFLLPRVIIAAIR
jgi:DNA-binding transcriptional LysR family regulator